MSLILGLTVISISIGRKLCAGFTFVTGLEMLTLNKGDLHSVSRIKWMEKYHNIKTFIKSKKYCVSTKSCPFICSEYTMKIRQDWLVLQ